MSLPPDIPQGVADALGYLQHHLQELMERQHVSENNINTILAALTMQLQQLTQLVANPSLPAVPNTPPPPAPSPPTSPSPAPMARQTRPKLSAPLDFSRERHNGHAFLNSCSLYIHLAPEQFYDEQEKILWALTFFKDGHAAKWSENIFHQEADTSIFPIPTWGDFEQQFRLHFFPVNVEVDAINTLEGTSYHQGGWTVDDYLDNFQTLVSDAGYRAARRIDQAHLANEAFQSMSRSTPSRPTKTVSA